MTDNTGGDCVVGALEEAGVEVVFGIPSVHNLPVYDALRRRGRIRPITVRHEQGAAGAADAYARVTGRPGVLITSTGPGAANAMGGLLEAFVSGSPVLHLTGQIETRHLGAGRGFIHEVPDQPAMLRSLSKAVLTAGSVDEIAPTVARGIALAMSAPRGPVSVEVPIDLQYANHASPGSAAIRSALEPAKIRAASAAELAAALEVLSSSRRPLVWAGGGVVSSGAEKEVAALVRRLGAGLMTSPNGRGVMAEDDPACLGNLSWEPAVRELCKRADLLIGIGTRYQGPNTENWKMQLPANIVQIDVDPARPARNYPASVAVAGDARQVVAALLEGLDNKGSPVAEPGWDYEVRRAAAAAREALRSTLGEQEGLLDELSGLIEPGTVVVKDSTIPAYTWGNRLLAVRRTRTTIMPNGFAIGLGLAHAVGAAAAGGPVVLLVGDGGIMLTAGELATIAEERLPVVVAVFNDGGYGILRNIQERQFGERIGVDLGRPDFVRLAEALGVKAAKASSTRDFGSEMRSALRSGEPHLVEVDLEAVGPMKRPYTGTSRPPGGTRR